MEARLRPLGLTVSQYSCLELLHRTPHHSNADLARGASVSAQSMNEVLRGLQRRGLVRRPADVTDGRARPALLSVEGEQALMEARDELQPVRRAVAAVAEAPENSNLLKGLRSIIAALDTN
jgi:DNA-binding MarR family transcriptional regulator